MTDWLKELRFKCPMCKGKGAIKLRHDRKLYICPCCAEKKKVRIKTVFVYLYWRMRNYYNRDRMCEIGYNLFCLCLLVILLYLAYKYIYLDYVTVHVPLQGRL